MEKQSSIYNTQFWLLCISNFLFSASFQMMIPELPDYLKGMGGKEYIGYIIALFTLTAGAARPFSGKLTDTVGRVPIMAIGSIVCFLCSGIYPFVHTVFGFLLLRFFHGFSTGTKPTATSAYVADIIPEDRRGEAQGMLGIFTATGMSLGPTIGSYLVGWTSISFMFFTSSAFALFSILILLNMKETLPKEQKQPFSLKLLKIGWADVFEPRVFPAFLVMLTVSYSSGVVLTLIPDQTKLVGLTNKGIFFTIYTISSLVVRLFFAKSSDKYGRIPILMISSAIMIVSMLMCAFADSVWLFVLASILFGFSWGFNTPTLMAWTVDLSHEDYRGRAIATTYIALEAGIGIGALVSGYLYKGVIENMAISYYFAGFLSFVSLVYLWVISKESVKLSSLGN
ncbi:putative MFS family arabinose efflux permease [Arcicella aurantiaca]|uniref:Putative MFS family arabinose efflux permease n=1 Tax=Arcicella aurantiaca TaxID=591202 RepID=A0A316EF62_9BACT|nr:MFS transporter [Arcicella aurantiaca]PWK29323.1 putative MFS family arabinose efflux permease [Arcicella aurantiaca]